MKESNPILLDTMERRRVSCPQTAQMLWDVIKTIKATGNVASEDKIRKQLLKDFGIKDDDDFKLSRHLENCVRDGLLEVVSRTVNKGTKSGSEVNLYSLPELKLQDDEYDWYCFDCHRPGDVIKCTKPKCLRVYHLACVSGSDQGPLVCHVCKMIEKGKKTFKMKRTKLNKVLGLGPLAKLKSRYPLTLRDQRLPKPKKNLLVSDRVTQALMNPQILPPVDESEAWRTHMLIVREMNMTLVEEKIDRRQYRSLEEFHADCLNILHNIIIYNGVDSAVADIARQMVRDCVIELNEIRQCVDCYKMTLPGSKKHHGFAKPCRKPHELVYVKHCGSNFWPAKVIKVDGDIYDVKLFGSSHDRIQVQKSHVKPITVSIHPHQVKKTTNWKKAYDELKKHQELLEKWKVETLNFTKFVDSNSSDGYESVDSDTLWHYERDWRKNRIHSIINKMHSGSKHKTKLSRSRSFSTVSTEKKRGRPRLTEVPANAKVPNSRPVGRPSKKRSYSSDSLDSFSAPAEQAPRKNTDEIFDELLKSDNGKPSTSSNAEKKDKKDGESSSRQSLKTVIAKPAVDINGGEMASEDSQTQDSSVTLSSRDTDKSRKKPPKQMSSSSADSGSDSDPGSLASSKKCLQRKRGRPKKSSTKTPSESSSSDSDSDLDGNNSTSISSDSEDSDDDDDDDDGDEALVKSKARRLKPRSAVPPAVVKPRSGRKDKEESVEVSSSSQEPVTKVIATQTEVLPMPMRLSNEVKVRNERIKDLEIQLQKQIDHCRVMENELDKSRLLIENMRADNDDEIAGIHENYRVTISEIKKKQWCYNCEVEAIYHCCWNTAYCSVECQQAHWQKEHKRVCRRKRP